MTFPWVSGLVAVLALAAGAVPASAGPPFLTDDPEPTDPGHWEIYGPFVEADGIGADFGGNAGVEINYGAAPDLQLTLALPSAFEHGASGWAWGSGDVELGAKYRVLHDEAHGLQIAAFPAITLPTARHGLGAGRVTALLPVWVQHDAGPWSMFGGGGYAIKPGAGNRNYWTGGIALTRQFGEGLTLGIEADRQGADTSGSAASTSLGLGAIVRLAPHWRLLASGGPTFSDAGGKAGFHTFAALGWDY